MRKVFLIIMCMFAIAINAQTIYYQKIDKKLSIGVGVSDTVNVVSILNKSKDCSLVIGHKTIETENSKIGKYYEHLIYMPKPVFDMFKQSLRRNSVYINNIEYTGLEIGAAVTAAEWYSDYHRMNPFIRIPKMRKPFEFRR